MARPTFLAACLLLLSPLAAMAQTSSIWDRPRTTGWTISPVLGSGLVWDNNVLIQELTTVPAADAMAALSPAGAIDYVGRRQEFSLTYNGAFRLYRSFNSLNSYEQTERLSIKRRLSSRSSLSGHQSFSQSPSTDLPALMGIPFTLVGSKILNAGLDFDTALSKRTTVVLAYNFESVVFDEDPLRRETLLGGRSQTAAVRVRRQTNARLTLTADYTILRATTAAADPFNVQNAWAGGEFRFSSRTRAFAMFGGARVDGTDAEGPQLLPSWRVGLSRQFEAFIFDTTYGRTFVPSYGSGGTQQNEELTSHLLLPLGRRFHTEATVAWRRDSTLVADDLPLTLVADRLPLTSIWVTGTVGYALRPWVRIEGFYSGLTQRIDRPGGELDRHRVGLQIVTGRPMRIS